MKKTVSIVLVLALGLASVSLAEENTWTTKTPMPTRRYLLSSSVVDGKIYAIGGTPNGSNCTPTVEAYDPLTDTWTKKADMPRVSGGAASGVVNGRIYIMGGGDRLWGPTYSSVIEYYARTDTWTPKADMPMARGWVSGSVVNGKIYVIGGASRYQDTALSTVEEYDPVTDTWARKADMPTARVCLSTSAVNGKIYAIGGCPGSSQWYRALSTVEEYDPATDTWTTKADMPTPRTYISTCALNGKIYAIGGLKTRANHVAPVEEYDPATDTWTSVADMPTTRSGVATSAVNGKLYAIGGWVGTSTILTTVEEYEPIPPIVVDFNGDGIVDSLDMCIVVDHWGEDYPLCDIAPTPFGDGIVDVQDLILLSEHLFEEVFDPALVAHWALNETEGMFATDSAGDNDAVVLGGAAWQPDSGQIGGALQLNGVDSFAIADAVLNPADGPFSVLAWINGGAPGQVVVSQQNAANWLTTDAEGNLMTELKSSDQLAGPLFSETVITDGQWHRIGLVWDGSNRTLYVDGVVVADDTPLGLEGSQMGLYIGTGKAMETVTYFSGLIDDIRIYNRIVSQ
ncbi:kelch repeat-containing protein [Planctomycetota bacterium]